MDLTLNFSQKIKIVRDETTFLLLLDSSLVDCQDNETLMGGKQDYSNIFFENRESDLYRDNPNEVLSQNTQSTEALKDAQTCPIDSETNNLGLALFGDTLVPAQIAQFHLFGKLDNDASYFFD